MSKRGEIHEALHPTDSSSRSSRWKRLQDGIRKRHFVLGAICLTFAIALVFGVLLVLVFVTF